MRSPIPEELFSRRCGISTSSPHKKTDLEMRTIHKVYSTITGASPPRQHAKCTITGRRKIKSTQRLADCNRSAFTEVLQKPVFIFHPRLSFFYFVIVVFVIVLIHFMCFGFQRMEIMAELRCRWEREVLMTAARYRWEPRGADESHEVQMRAASCR